MPQNADCCSSSPNSWLINVLTLMFITVHFVNAQLDIYLPIKYKVDQVSFALIDIYSNLHSHTILIVNCSTLTRNMCLHLQNQQECIYDHFQPNDRITFSVFLHDALRSRPQISISYEGPVAGSELVHNEGSIDPRNPTSFTLGRHLQQSISKHWPVIKDADKIKRSVEDRIGVFNHQYTVDWTHAGEEEDTKEVRMMIQEQNHHKHQSWEKQVSDLERLEKEGKFDMKFAPHRPVHTVPMASIAPFEQTKKVTAEGWYRLCVKGVDSTPVMVEMDMRSMNNFNGIDEVTGHVYTFDKRRMLDEAALL